MMVGTHMHTHDCHALLVWTLIYSSILAPNNNHQTKCPTLTLTLKPCLNPQTAWPKCIYNAGLKQKTLSSQSMHSHMQFIERNREDLALKRLPPFGK